MLTRNERHNPSVYDTIALEWEEKGVFDGVKEGGFTVYVPALPACISQGDTEQEALMSIQEAIDIYLEPVDDDRVLDDRALVQEIEV